MTDTNVFQFSQPGTFADPLTEVLRNGARALLAVAMPTSLPRTVTNGSCATGICPKRVGRRQSPSGCSMCSFSGELLDNALGCQRVALGLALLIGGLAAAASFSRSRSRVTAVWRRRVFSDSSRKSWLRRPESGSAQSFIPTQSRQTVRSAAMITGPRKRPTNPNDFSPPRIPISTNRKGSRVLPPMSAG